MITVLVLIISYFIIINGKITNLKIVNVTYGPRGQFVSEMVLVPKKHYEELRTEFHKMESDNVYLVQQMSLLRAKPLSYYEDELDRSKSEDLSQVVKTTSNSPRYEFKTTNSSQVIKMITDVPKHEFNTIPFEDVETTTANITKHEFNTTNSSKLMVAITNHPKYEFNSTVSLQDAETTIAYECTTNLSQVIKTTINVTNHEFNTTIPPQDVETTIANISKHEFNTFSIPVVKTTKNYSRIRFNATKSRRVKKKTTNKITLESNASGDQETNQNLTEVDKLNHTLQKEIINLRRERNETHNYMYEFKWKILVKQTIDDYEDDFDKLELRNIQPSFQLNQKLVNETIESWKFDRLAERRRQRWEFYLKTPPYSNNTFERLVKRIESRKFTVEEFCRALATLYKLISFTSHLETIKPAKVTAGFLSHYHKLHFVVSLLLEDYPRTELIENIFNELKL